MTDTELSPAEQCLQLIAYGAHQRKFGNPQYAARAFTAAIVAGRSLHEPGQHQALAALAMYNLSLLKLPGVGAEDAAKLRRRAAEFLGPGEDSPQLPKELLPLFQEMMAEALADVGENQRAIPFCEVTVRNLAESQNAVSLAAALWRTGRCYVRMGLRDHAAVSLRAAVKLYRTLAGDPRLTTVLIDLGNALRKSAPEEAERCYSEAAEIYVSRAQLESACPAWVNLGVLCSEQGRHVEALAYYEKALHVREHSPGTPPERVGTLYNNLANAHRRMGNFQEAERSLERALPLVAPGGGYSLACAYGTRALILRDQGRDAEAVTWFRKSAAQHLRQASPNLDTLSEELENEAAALTRLARGEEAAAVRHELESVRASMAAFAAATQTSAEFPPPGDGAVLVEFDFGSRAEQRSGNREASKLEQRLSKLVVEEETGWLGGHAVIPEATTLFFYGSDAEALFRTLHPALLSEPICAGARVIIRQGSTHREITLPQRVA